MTEVTLTIERNDEGHPWCLRISQPIAAFTRTRRTIATIYRDGVDEYTIFARNTNGRHEKVAKDPYWAIGYAGNFVLPNKPFSVPEEWLAIVSQFVTETQADAEEMARIDAM